MNALFFSIIWLFLAAAAIPRRVASPRSDGILPQELWCVAKNNADDSSLQSALDWACGPGGASCSPIETGGACFDGTDLQDRASYAFNDYFLKHNLTEDSCDFSNTAALTSLNPSHDKCKLPSSFTVTNGKSGISTSTLGTGSSAEEDTSGSGQVTDLHSYLLTPAHRVEFFSIFRNSASS